MIRVIAHRIAPLRKRPLVQAYRNHPIVPAADAPQQLIVKSRPGLPIRQRLKRPPPVDQFLAMQNHRLIRMRIKVARLDVLQLGMNAPPHLVRLRNHSGKAQKPVISVVDPPQAGIPNLVNIKPVLCHQPPILRLYANKIWLPAPMTLRGRQPNSAAPAAYFPSHPASSTLPGVMGSRVSRRPMAAPTALAMAASGGTIGTSPTPRTP